LVGSEPPTYYQYLLSGRSLRRKCAQQWASGTFINNGLSRKPEKLEPNLMQE
jgi:hypothetical protein